MAGRFLAGIAAVVWSVETGKYLLLKRSKTKDFAPNVWECVTGRVEQNESYIEALYRETYEELGVVVQPICILGTTHFYRGTETVENELLGVVYGCELSDESAPILSDEHDDMCWINYDQAISMLDAQDPSTRWLLRVLHRVEVVKKLTPDGLMDYYRDCGFELG